MTFELVDIRTAKQRIEFAEWAESELEGSKQDGLEVGLCGNYYIINDGQDRWLVEQSDYDDAIAMIVNNVLTGDYDRHLGGNPIDCEFYNAICGSVDVIYSRCNSSTVADVFALELEPEDTQEIIDQLSLEDEAEEYLAEHPEAAPKPRREI